MADGRTKELLNDQLLQRDPFQKAQEMRKRGDIVPTAMEFNPFENPLSPFEERPVLSPGLPEQPEKNLAKTLAPATDMEIRSFMKSRISSHIDGLGLGDIKEGIGLTNMGKILLMARLKERVGDNFESNPAVRSILTQFDAALQKVDEKDEEADLVRAKSSGDRTIKELLGDRGKAGL